MEEYLNILNLENKTGWPKRFIRYQTGAFLFEMSQKEFIRLAKECNSKFKTCIYKPKKIVLVDARVIEEYIECFAIDS